MMKRSTTKTFIKKEIKTNNIVNVNDCIWEKKSLAMNTRPASRQTVCNGLFSLPSQDVVRNWVTFAEVAFTRDAISVARLAIALITQVHWQYGNDVMPLPRQ